MYEAIIFDVDGTLLDTEQAVLSSLQEALKEEGLNYQKAELRFALGIPGEKAIQQLNIDHKERVLANWAKKEATFANEVKLFSGIKEILPVMPTSGVVTSKNAQEMAIGFYPFGIADHFDVIVCADDTRQHKPHPEPLLKAMELLNKKANQTLYIGDSIYDMACAHAAGVDFGLALWGAKNVEEFKEAECVFNSPDEILIYI